MDYKVSSTNIIFLLTNLSVQYLRFHTVFVHYVLFVKKFRVVMFRVVNMIICR